MTKFLVIFLLFFLSYSFSVLPFIGFHNKSLRLSGISHRRADIFGIGNWTFRPAVNIPNCGAGNSIAAFSIEICPIRTQLITSHSI